MKFPSFLKKKRTYAILALLLIGGWWIFGRGQQPADLYETDAVTRGTLRRTVEVTGEVKPAQRIALAFEQNGTLSTVNVKVGQEVHAGDVLAELGKNDVLFALRRAAAAVATARANLNLKRAGETPQAIRVAETDVEKAQAAYDKALVDRQNTDVTTENDVKTSALAVETARRDLENTDETKIQAVADAYADLRATLLSALGSMQTALTDGDKIIGVDDTVTNSTYKPLIGISDYVALTRAKTTYTTAKILKRSSETLVRALSDASTESAIDAAATSTRQALDAIQSYLTEVQKTLAASIAGNGFTESDLTSKKSQIDTDRSSVSTQQAAVENGVQAVTTAKLAQTSSRDSLSDAYENAKLNLEIAQAKADTDKKTAASTVAINKAALDAAQAILELKKAGPRAVDLAPMEASLQEAQVAYDQASADLEKVRIKAPVDGVVSEVIPTIGERVTMNTPAIRMIGFADYDVEVLLPEADVAKVKVAQSATLTLDAYGDSREFTGTVVSIEPDQTVVQDAVYYKARIAVNKDSAGDADIKPGMTANVTVLTAQADNVLIIPIRAVRTDQETNEQRVRILQNDAPQDRVIKTGLRGDEGRIEVTEGLNEGETVIVSERSS